MVKERLGSSKNSIGQHTLNQDNLIKELKQTGVVDTIMNELQLTIGHQAPSTAINRPIKLKNQNEYNQQQHDHSVSNQCNSKISIFSPKQLSITHNRCIRKSSKLKSLKTEKKQKNRV